MSKEKIDHLFLRFLVSVRNTYEDYCTKCSSLAIKIKQNLNFSTKYFKFEL